jgi:hypothetical protein
MSPKRTSSWAAFVEKLLPEIVTISPMRARVGVIAARAGVRRR